MLIYSQSVISFVGIDDSERKRSRTRSPRQDKEESREEKYVIFNLMLYGKLDGSIHFLLLKG